MLTLPNAALATTITSFQDASLTTGSLAGVNFTFSFSYDDAALAGSGQEFLSLTSFDFTLLGTPFTLADVTQGGQAIFQSGVLQNVTAAFLTIPPRTAPVFDIAFGFGGPGVIGYIDLAHNFGSGTYSSSLPVNVSEPPTLYNLALGIAALCLIYFRRCNASPS